MTTLAATARSTHELYDEEADPGEFVNLIDDPGMKKVADDLRDRLFAWYDPSANPWQDTAT